MRFKTFLAIWLWFTPVYAEDSPTSEALSRESVSSNTSELFAKVLALEENMREMTGKLQQYEHNVQELSKQLNELSSGSAITQSSSNKTPDEKLFSAIQLIENKRFSESITQLRELVESTSGEQHFATPGEVSFWLAKAYLGKGEYGKASAYLAKSYRYYSEIKSNYILLKLVEVLVLERSI